MKIAQISPFYWPASGGVEEAVRRVSEELVKKGHEVHVYTSQAKSKQCEKMNGVYIHRFPVYFSIGSFAKLWPSFTLKLIANSFDIIHAHVYRHPHTLLALPAAKIKRAKAVLTTHCPFHPLHVWGRLGYLVKLYDATVGKAVKFFDAIFVQASFELEYMKHLGAWSDRVYLIPNGVGDEHFAEYDGKIFREKYRVSEDYILYLGKLHRTKGLTFLLRAFKELLREGYSLKLAVAGNAIGDYNLYLKALTSRLGISHNVVFTGFVSDVEKTSMLHDSLFLVLPSVFEPFGIVLLEAMAHRKPVIATKHGGPPDFVKDGYNGFLINYGDINNLASKMKILLNDKKLSYLMGIRAQKTATMYKWPIIVSKIERIYETLTGR